MKQRLGVAAALLKDPELLILDEPTNGLDPAGMAEMRDADPLARPAASGRSLLSSHLMGEVEQICDRVGVIRAGRLVAEGTVDELRGRAGAARAGRSRSSEAARLLVGAAWRRARSTRVDGALRVAADPGRAAAINRALVERRHRRQRAHAAAAPRWRTCSSSSPRREEAA